ncbi:MAG: flagellar hook-length control protein FliK, partial [Nitrospirae bacterium]
MFPLKGPEAKSLVSLLIPGGRGLRLQKGDFIRAEVLRMVSPNTVEVSLKGIRLTAKTSVPLTAGSSVDLMVQQVGKDRVILSLISPLKTDRSEVLKLVLSALKSENIARLKAKEINDTVKGKLASLPQSVKKNFPEVEKLIEYFNTPDDLQPAGFGTAMRRSGIFFETAIKIILKRFLQENLQEEIKKPDTPSKHGMQDRLLAEKEEQPLSPQKPTGTSNQIPPHQIKRYLESDIKGILLTLRAKLDNRETLEILKSEGVNIGGFKKTIEGLLKNIEHYQFHTVLSETTQTWIPLIWDELKDGELLFDKTPKHQDEGSFTCAVKLDLEGAGRVVSLIYFTQGGFNIRFFTERTEFAERISAGLDHLKEQFENAGLNLLSMTVAQGLPSEKRGFPEDRV